MFYLRSVSSRPGSVLHVGIHMVRCFAVVVFSVVLLGLWGCAPVRPSAEPDRAAAVPPVEPNEAGVQQPPEPVATPRELDGVSVPSNNLAEPVADEVTPPTSEELVGETPIQADPNRIEDDKPLRDTPSESDVAVSELDGTATRTEPNVVAVQVEERPAWLAFREPYAEILGTYVRKDGLVDYGSLRRRRLDLKPILAVLDELDPNVYQSWSRQEQLAFWIDAYNLKMLEIIVRNYPIESSWWLRLTWPPSDIRHIEGIWTDYRFIVMEEEFTLAEVEQRFFRRRFDDPRVLLAITYACQSSPSLDRRPYLGGPVELDRRLDEQVKRFLASPQGLRIDRRNGVVRLSALFKPSWRGKEFVTRYGTDKKFKNRDPETRAVLSFLTNYLPPQDVEFLEVENYTLEYLNFDWRLNDTAKGY